MYGHELLELHTHQIVKQEEHAATVILRVEECKQGDSF